MRNKTLTATIIAVLILLTACGSTSTAPNETVTETVVQPEDEQVAETAAEEETGAEPVLLTEFDDLQSMFCAMSYDTTIEDVETMIAERGLDYTAKEYSSNKLTYKIAYSADVAKQSHAKEGDNVEITFAQDEGVFMYAEYFNAEAFKSAILYNYGTYWDFREEVSNNVYSGYYYHSPGDKKGGITVEYSNGNSVETGYQACESAEEAVSHAVVK